MNLPTASPNDIIDELESLATYLQELYPDSRIERQNVPKSPIENTFVVRFQNANSVSETHLSYVDMREWQLIYIGGKQPADVADVLMKMNGLKRHTVGSLRQAIPIKDSLRYMRIGSFAFSQPFKMENDNFACIGVLTTEVRKARDIETFEKIMKAGVSARTN